MRDRKEKRAKWDDHVRTHIAARNGDPDWTAYLLALWHQHLEADFAHDHFVRELTKGEDGAFFQRIWEMMIGRHMLACGYDVTCPSKDGRPDFRCEKDGHATWIEATCISAGQDTALAPDADWLCSSGYVPLDNILLRWANALDSKMKQAKAHRAAGTVGSNDSYIVAINGGVVAVGNHGFGVSQYPFVVETTMAVGALQFSFDRETLWFWGASHQVRVNTLKSNKSPVNTAAFLHEENAGISALVGYASLRSKGAKLPLLIAHNPYAACPIASGHLGSEAREWAAKFCRRDDSAAYWEITEIVNVTAAATLT